RAEGQSPPVSSSRAAFAETAIASAKIEPSRRPSQRPEEESVVVARRGGRLHLPAPPRPHDVVTLTPAGPDPPGMLARGARPRPVKRRCDATDDLCHRRCRAPQVELAVLV